MNKILVEIYVPAIGEHFDIFVPVDVPIRDVTKVITDGVVEVTNERYVASQCEQLCLNEPVGLLDPLRTLEDYGVKIGMKLYLV